MFMLPTLSLEKGAQEAKKHRQKKCSVVGKPGIAKKHKKLLFIYEMVSIRNDKD